MVTNFCTCIIVSGIVSVNFSNSFLTRRNTPSYASFVRPAVRKYRVVSSSLPILVRHAKYQSTYHFFLSGKDFGMNFGQLSVFFPGKCLLLSQRAAHHERTFNGCLPIRQIPIGKTGIKFFPRFLPNMPKKKSNFRPVTKFICPG